MLRSGSQWSASALTLFTDQQQGAPRSAEGSEMGLNLFIARSAFALGLGGPITHCQRMNLRRGPVTHQRLALGANVLTKKLQIYISNTTIKESGGESIMRDN